MEEGSEMPATNHQYVHRLISLADYTEKNCVPIHLTTAKKRIGYR